MDEVILALLEMVSPEVRRDMLRSLLTNYEERIEHSNHQLQLAKQQIRFTTIALAQAGNPDALIDIASKKVKAAQSDPNYKPVDGEVMGDKIDIMLNVIRHLVNHESYRNAELSKLTAVVMAYADRVLD